MTKRYRFNKRLVEPLPEYSSNLYWDGGNFMNFMNSNGMQEFQKMASMFNNASSNRPNFLAMNSKPGSGLLGTIGSAVDTTGQILEGIANLTNKKRESLSETVGLTDHWGNRTFSGGGNLGVGGITDMANTGMALVGNAVNQAQIKDTKDLEAGIKSYGNNQVESNDYDSLMDEWGNRSELNHISWRDLMNHNGFQAFANTLSASGQGFQAGSAAGPIGAAVGGVVGGLSSAIGSIIARRRAKRKAKKINKKIDNANVQNLLSFDERADNIDTSNDLNAMNSFIAAYGGQLPNNQIDMLSGIDNEYGNGGKIHIKPENRGKFTALKKRTGKSSSWYKEHGTPAQKKMATFALNARKWKHDDGGGLEPPYDQDFLDWVDSLPENLKRHDQNYDLRGAYDAGLKPMWNEDDKSYHLQTRDPRTGLILKKPTHSTFLMGMLEDTKKGYYPYVKDGKVYTDTWIGNKFEDGGNRNELLGSDAYIAREMANGLTREEAGRKWLESEERRIYNEYAGKRHKEELDLERRQQEDAIARQKGYSNHEEYKNAVENEARQQEENRAKENEQSMNSVRNVASSVTNNVNESVDMLSKSGKAIAEAAENERQKSINTWKPALAVTDLALSSFAALTGNPYISAANMLTNGLQLGDDIATGQPWGMDVSSLAFDTIGMLGYLGKLPRISMRGNLGNRRVNVDINTNKVADYSGRGWNVVDYVRDVSDLKDWSDMKYATPRPYSYRFAPFQRALGGKTGNFSNGLVNVNNGGTHEENPNEGVPFGVDYKGVPNLLEEGETVYGDYVFSNRLKPDNDLLKGFNINKKSKGKTFAKIARSMGKESEERPNDPISKAGLKKDMEKLQAAQEVIRNEKAIEEQEMMNELMKRKIKKCGGMLTRNANKFGNGSYTQRQWSKDINKAYKDWLKAGGDDYSWEDIPLPPSWQKKNNGNRFFGKSGANLRFAPILGSMIGTGLAFKKPDYTGVNTISDAAEVAGTYNPVEFEPIGNYLQYVPMDRNFYLNKLASSAAATRRAMMNSTSPSRYAGLLMSDYNTQGKIGELARQAEDYNWQRRQAVEQFNRQTNMANSEGMLKAGMANQQADANAKQARLRGLTAAMSLRDEIQKRVNEERSSSLSDLFNNIGAVGREGFFKNMVNDNPAWYYMIYGNGDTGYKGARGGYLTRPKKRRK